MYLKAQKLRLLEEEAERKRDLPHLHGFPFYKWSLEFFNSRSKLLFLTAGNQLSKSSTQHRKLIHWATEPSLWPTLWPGSQPLVFWLLYPTLQVFDIEVRKKIVPEFLPRGKMKDHPQYGWSLERGPRGLITAINFNSGVSILGKSYMTDLEALQTGTVWYLAFDEEMPESLWPELQARVRATRGYISGVFTPTLSQQFWYDVMEAKGENEALPTAHKITASMWDCLTYADGRPSQWTREEIIRAINETPNQDEVQRRIYGRFVMKKENMVYPSFNDKVNVGSGDGKVPKDWVYYVGIDSGSGTHRHPAAIVFVAVSPDHKKGRVTDMWLGEQNQVETSDGSTTATDILLKYMEMKTGKNVITAFYDHQDIDMSIIAEREGIDLIKAQKSNTWGTGVLNTLFKNEMLEIDKVENWQILVRQIKTLRHVTQKNLSKNDDLVDSLRYACASVPWNFSGISAEEIINPKKREYTQEEINKDRRLAMALDDYEKDRIQTEIEEVNREFEV